MNPLKAVFLSAALMFTSVSAMNVSATAYSLRGVTASGKYTRPGTVAVSRDLLRQIPLGSVIRLSVVKGSHCGGFNTGPLDVTDKMAGYIHNTVDVWVGSSKAARSWGRCKAKLTVLRRG